MKILILESFIKDFENYGIGGVLSRQYHIRELSKLCQVYVPYEKEEKLGDNIWGIPIINSQKGVYDFRYDYHRVEKEAFDGIIVTGVNPNDIVDYSYRRIKQSAPVIQRYYSIRGIGEVIKNSVLAEYYMLNDWDILSPISNWAKRMLEQFICRKERIQVIPIGVDHKIFKPMDKKWSKAQVANWLNRKDFVECPVIGFLSRFEIEKGSTIFLRLAQENPDYLFCAVGIVPNDYHHLIGDNVVLTGFQPREKLPIFLNSFDVYCFPSMVGSESYGMSVLEAMACGVPPIVTNFNGVPELVGDAGLTVETQTYQEDIGYLSAFPNIEEFSEKIRYLIEDLKVRKKLADKARERSFIYNWEKIAQRHIELFHQIEVQRREYPFSSIPFPVSFYREYSREQESLLTKAIFHNVLPDGNKPLTGHHYEISPEEGLVLTLLKEHTLGEIEAILLHITRDKDKAHSILQKIERFAKVLLIK